MNCIRCFVVLVALIVLAGCSTTNEPKYPAELQMIIATSGQQNAARSAGSAAGGNGSNAISVAQLLASVRNPQTEAEQEKKTSAAKAHPRVPAWVFNGKPQHQQQTAPATVQTYQTANHRKIQPSNSMGIEKTASQQQLALALIKGAGQSSETQKPASTESVVSKTVVKRIQKPQPQQLRLSYQTHDALPNDVQLQEMRLLATKQNMTLVKLTFGASKGLSPMESVAQAHKRAKQLLAQLSLSQEAKIEYQPKLGHDIAVVTFEPRG